jgi:AAHS family 3-hydroxyphenylpropionic acid transporter
MNNQNTERTRLITTIGLCFLVALLEGVDLQSAGIAAQGLAKALMLDKPHMSFVFSVGIFGMLPGAFIGGRLADYLGRKRVLIASVIVFGLFSLATTATWDFTSLLAARLLTGIGLGSAMPNLIALCSENAGERHRATAVTIMYCGMPLGAALIALVNAFGYSAEWKSVFYIGGLLPLLITPLLAFFMPESTQFNATHTGAGSHQASGALRGLLGKGMLSTTLLLWVSYFFTLMVVYMLMNWLPTLLVGQGFSPRQAGWIIFSLQTGATIGTVALGQFLTRLPPWGISILTYAGLLIGLTALGVAGTFGAMLCAAFVAGFFVNGAQGVLYALAPNFYPTVIRGTGVGSAIAVGRLGAMSGPLVAGQMLALGVGTTGVLAASTPGIVIAAIALFWLGVRNPARARA